MISYNPQKIEEKVLSYWKKNKVYDKAKAKNKGKKQFYFLDGPPYTSGKIHIGHAWNKTLKDCALRYLRMKGLDVFDRAGYDMHGLPVEKKVEAKLKLDGKEAILKFGMNNFIKECESYSRENLKLMNKEFKDLGVWMDFDNAYQPIKTEFIEGVWWLVKEAHKNKRLYQGEKTMTWCKSCGTALAKHELEYENVTDNSIFVKFKVKNTKNEYFIIWTTTPWTIPFNLGIMVHPDLEYVKIKVEDEVWVVAKGLVNAFMNSVVDKKFKVLEEFKGKKLKGMKYVHPMKDEIEFFKNVENEKIHSVVLSSEYVDLSAGTGLVHMAPGCGPEDYEVGHKEGIPPFNLISEEGVFPKEAGCFEGLTAKDNDDKFIQWLKEDGSLIASTPVEHDYAHCWRCKSPVVFRTTTQWFFKVEDLVKELRELNSKTKWVPDWAGANWFDSWLENLRDNSITRQRFWGTPLPIWQCDKCEKFEIIGNKKELEKHAKVPSNLHRPWIDNVKWKCSCGGKFTRIPDIIDVWVDSGSVSWTCLDFPQRKDLFEKLFPADLIIEGKDQIRGWFNLLLISSMVSHKKPSYKNVYMHGFINDSNGRKMSKSTGNVIRPGEVFDQYGVDAFRYYAIGAANPGVDMNYNFDDIKVRYRNIGILWNLHRYIIEYAKGLKLDKPRAVDVEEKYIISKLHSTIKEVTTLFDNYKLDKVPDVIESLFLELSRTYIQLTREKVVDEREKVVQTIYTVFMEVLKLFAPIAPFVTEEIYLNLKKEFNLKEESIHLFDWPKFDSKKIDLELENNVDVAMDVVQGLLSAREKTGFGGRWPLKEAVLLIKDVKAKKAVKELKDLILNQVNIKDFKIKSEFEVTYEIKPNFRNLGRKFKEDLAEIIPKLNEIDVPKLNSDGKFILKVGKKKFEIVKDDILIIETPPEDWTLGNTKYGPVYMSKLVTEDLKIEGFARELTRRVQYLRKQKNLIKQDRINLFIDGEEDLIKKISKWEDRIKKKVGAKTLSFEKNKGSEEKISQKIFTIDFKKI
jgi:isoleucyl-tRNA synthetase